MYCTKDIYYTFGPRETKNG